MSGIPDTCSGSAAAPRMTNFSVYAEAAQSRAHRVAVGHHCQDHLGAAELEQFRGGVLRFAIDVIPGAEFSRQRFLVQPARNRNGSKSHLCCELNSQMAESADAKYCDEIAWLAPLWRRG